MKPATCAANPYDAAGIKRARDSDTYDSDHSTSSSSCDVSVARIKRRGQPVRCRSSIARLPPEVTEYIALHATPHDRAAAAIAWRGFAVRPRYRTWMATENARTAGECLCRGQSQDYCDEWEFGCQCRERPPWGDASLWELPGCSHSCYPHALHAVTCSPQATQAPALFRSAWKLGAPAFALFGSGDLLNATLATWLFSFGSANVCASAVSDDPNALIARFFNACNGRDTQSVHESQDARHDNSDGTDDADVKSCNPRLYRHITFEELIATGDITAVAAGEDSLFCYFSDRIESALLTAVEAGHAPMVECVLKRMPAKWHTSCTGLVAAARSHLPTAMELAAARYSCNHTSLHCGGNSRLPVLRDDAELEMLIDILSSTPREPLLCLLGEALIRDRVDLAERIWSMNVEHPDFASAQIRYQVDRLIANVSASNSHSAVLWMAACKNRWDSMLNAGTVEHAFSDCAFVSWHRAARYLGRARSTTERPTDISNADDADEDRSRCNNDNSYRGNMPPQPTRALAYIVDLCRGAPGWDLASALSILGNALCIDANEELSMSGAESVCALTMAFDLVGPKGLGLLNARCKCAVETNGPDDPDCAWSHAAHKGIVLQNRLSGKCVYGEHTSLLLLPPPALAFVREHFACAWERLVSGMFATCDPWTCTMHDGSCALDHCLASGAPVALGSAEWLRVLWPVAPEVERARSPLDGKRRQHRLKAIGAVDTHRRNRRESLPTRARAVAVLAHPSTVWPLGLAHEAARRGDVEVIACLRPERGTAHGMEIADGTGITWSTPSNGDLRTIVSVLIARGYAEQAETFARLHGLTPIDHGEALIDAARHACVVPDRLVLSSVARVAPLTALAAVDAFARSTWPLSVEHLVAFRDALPWCLAGIATRTGQMWPALGVSRAVWLHSVCGVRFDEAFVMRCAGELRLSTVYWAIASAGIVCKRETILSVITTRSRYKRRWGARELDTKLALIASSRAHLWLDRVWPNNGRSIPFVHSDDDSDYRYDGGYDDNDDSIDSDDSDDDDDNDNDKKSNDDCGNIESTSCVLRRMPRPPHHA